MNATCLIILIALGLRLALAAGSGLGIDESYMVAASTHFSASYFDHPLASWWLELAVRHVCDSAAPIVVRLPFVLLSGISSWLLYLITRRLFGRQAGFWAVVAYSIAPVFSLAFGSWVLPDGPLNTALLAFLYALIRATGLPAGAEISAPAGLSLAASSHTPTAPSRPSPLQSTPSPTASVQPTASRSSLAAAASPSLPSWWLLAGLFAGLAMLSKYNAGLVLLGAAIAVLLDPISRRQLATPWPWLGAMLAAALLTPIILWNFQHHWISFNYQGGRALGLRLRPFMPFTIWGGEALYVLPWLWVPMIWVLLRGFITGPALRTTWLLAWAGVIPVLLFALVGFWSHTRILYHWAAPGYLMLFPLLGNWATRQHQAFLKIIALASGLLLALAVLLIIGFTQLGLPALLAHGFKPGKSPMLQAVDWTSIGPELPKGIDAIAAQRWFDAGKIGYALRRDGISLPITVFGAQPHQFAITTPPASLRGKTVLIIAMPGSPATTYARFAPDFASLKPGPTLTVLDHGTLLLAIPTFIGTDLQTPP